MSNDNKRIINQYVNESLELNSRFLWTGSSTVKRFDISKYLLEKVNSKELNHFFNNNGSIINVELPDPIHERDNTDKKIKKIIRDANEFLQTTGHWPLKLSWGMLIGATKNFDLLRTPFLLTSIKLEVVRKKLKITNIEDVVSPNMIALCKILKASNRISELKDYYNRNFNGINEVLKFYKKFITIKDEAFLNDILIKVERIKKQDYNPTVIYELKNNEFVVENNMMIINIGSTLNYVYENNIELQNKMISALPFTEIEKNAPDPIEAKELEFKINETKFYNEIYKITPLNISQEKVINKALKYNIAVQGPPGTGKTETITNLIANYIALNKTALITAEKYAALEVLKKKTEALNPCIFILTNDKDLKTATHDLCKKILLANKHYKNNLIFKHENPKNVFINNNVEPKYLYANKLIRTENEFINTMEFSNNESLRNWKQKLDEDKIDILRELSNKKWWHLWNTKYSELIRASDNVEKINKNYLNSYIKNNQWINDTYFNSDKYVEQINLIVQNHYYSILYEWKNNNVFLAAYKELVKEAKHQLKLKKKLKPLRKLINKYGDVLFKIIPVWIMPVNLVCKYFELKIKFFDYVVFDEASQVFMCRALPIINRGKKIAIFGDPKQMQPSDDFTTRFIEIDENEAEEDDGIFKYKSLFDWASANCFEDELTFHYRSKNSKLIEFSNKHFYGNDLEVFRKPIEDDKSVKIINADGFWSNNNNLIEAKEIMILLNKLQKNNPEKSIAVITFNFHQKELINELIEGDEILKRLIDVNNEKFHNSMGKDEPLIVRNIENIQGDERDIIIFSVVYGRREIDNSKIVSNYGSLSRSGGENRLNVALTRARENIYVIKSVYGKDFYGKKSESVGTKLLWKWFDYLDTYGKIHKKEIDIVEHNKRDLNYFEQMFADDYYEYFVEKKRYQLDSQVKLGRYSGKHYFLDFAIYDKVDKKYVLAIELDGKQFHYNSLGEFKKSDIDRQIFIENMGWRFIRFNYEQYTLNTSDCWKKVLDMAMHSNHRDVNKSQNIWLKVDKNYVFDNSNPQKKISKIKKTIKLNDTNIKNDAIYENDPASSKQIRYMEKNKIPHWKKMNKLEATKMINTFNSKKTRKFD